VDPNEIAESPKLDEIDVAVVGGSFAGLSAAMQLGRARRRVLLVDAGQPRNRFARASHGFLGQDSRAPQDILMDGRRQVLAYPNVQFREGEATHAVREDDSFRLRLANGQEVRARRLVLATGVTDHLPNLPGMRELWGTGVNHCPYCHGYEVSDRRLAVFSTGPGSIHQALLLRDWSEDVTLLTNGTHMLTEEERDRLQVRGVRIEQAPVARLIGAGGELGAVELEDGRCLPFGALFTVPRVTLSSPLAERLGCELEAGPMGPFVKTDHLKESTVPGVYVAGDAARPMHTATWASADGVSAGIASHQSLIFPRQRPS
jgi:thioredoxin reductase